MFFGNKKLIEAQAKEIEELKQQLAQTSEKNAALEKEVAELKAREFAVAKAMTDANMAAEGILSLAREESGKTKEQAEKELADAESASRSIRSNAEETASRVMAEAEEKATKVISEAENKSEDILADAEVKSQQRLQKTEDEVRSYASILVKLNENMKEQVKLAQEASERYAAFYEQMSKSLPGIMNSINGAQLPEAKKDIDSPAVDAKTGENVITVSDILVQEPINETVSTEDILNSISK